MTSQPATRYPQVRPGITRSDSAGDQQDRSAPSLGADLAVMERDAKRMRGERSCMFTNLKDGTGVSSIVDWLCANLRSADSLLQN
jgi:urease accessory protein